MGHYDENGKMVQVTAGMSGTYNNDDSVAFFGGGDLAKAIYTVQKYKENPNYEPTTEELASMAKAVITHGGRAILNDIILRGYVYAEGGVFRGNVYAADGEFNGTIYAKDGEFTGKVTSIGGSFTSTNNWGGVKLVAATDIGSNKEDASIIEISSPRYISNGQPSKEQYVSYKALQTTEQGYGYAQHVWYTPDGSQVRINGGHIELEGGDTYWHFSNHSMSCYQGNMIRLSILPDNVQILTEKVSMPYLPRTKDECEIGHLYIDGDTIKIRNS
jgi:hypothetical protein